jgi:hypothetical protein
MSEPDLFEKIGKAICPEMEEDCQATIKNKKVKLINL